MLYVKILLISLILILSSGCSQKDISVKTEEVQKQKLNLQNPIVLTQEQFKWYVITPENSSEVWDRMQEDGVDLVLFGLTDTGYEKLSNNISKTTRFIFLQREILEQYKKYYEGEVNE